MYQRAPPLYFIINKFSLIYYLQSDCFTTNLFSRCILFITNFKVIINFLHNIYDLILNNCFRNNEVKFVSVTHKLKLLIAKCDFVRCALEQIKLLVSQIGEIQKSKGIRDKIASVKRMTWCR